MRCFFTILAIILGLATGANGQNIVLGEVAPDLKIKQWLMDMQPDAADLTCVLFYHSESPQCRKSISRVKEFAAQFDGNMNVVILTKERYDKAGVSLTEHLGDHTAVAFDDEGRTFRAYGVKFIPFCVIYNSKRMAVWCGHAQGLSEKVAERIKNTKKR